MAEFHYVPTGTGVISGREVLRQTEDAINNALEDGGDTREIAEQALATANTALTTAGQAIETSNTALSNSEQAQTSAASAVSTANQATATAQTALSTAQQASTTATNAVTAAQAAQTAAENAASDAADSEDIAAQALTSAQSAQTAAEAAQTAAETAQTDADQSAALATQAQSAAAQSAQSAAQAAAAVGASARHIGEIVSSALPLTTAGLHLLDGALIDGSGIYSDFVTYIGNLYQNDPTAAYFTDETSWQSSVTNYGVCGKFVYDSVNNTVRLPKITGIVEGTTDLTALGDLVQAGLPNITGYFGKVSQTFSGDNEVSGAFSWTFTGVNVIGNNSGNYSGNIYFDASRSSSVYGNSSTVQPQTIKTLVYIVVATVTKTDIQVDIDNVVTELNRLDSNTVHADHFQALSETQQAQVRTNINCNPVFNKMDRVTSSGTYTVPVSGWYKITVIGGGGGGASGAGSTSDSNWITLGAAGSSGGVSIAYKKLASGTQLSCTIGAGGSGGEKPSSATSTGNSGADGGTSSVVIEQETISAGGGDGAKGRTGTCYGGSGTYRAGAYGTNPCPAVSVANWAPMGANGYTGQANCFGKGGHGGTAHLTLTYIGAGHSGADGCIEFEYFDPSL